MRALASRVDSSPLMTAVCRRARAGIALWLGPMPGHQAAETRPPGRIPVDLFVLAMQPALVNSPDLHANPITLHANPITESDIRHNLAYRPLRDSAPDGLPEALSGLHINPRSQPADTALPRAA
jgi:hypothetical protein